MSDWQLRHAARFDADGADLRCDYAPDACDWCGDDCADNPLDDEGVCERCRAKEDEN